MARRKYLLGNSMARKPSLKWPLTEAAFKEVMAKVRDDITARLVAPKASDEEVRRALAEIHSIPRIENAVRQKLDKE
jgi:hypothetical protein